MRQALFMRQLGSCIYNCMYFTMNAACLRSSLDYVQLRVVNSLSSGVRKVCFCTQIRYSTHSGTRPARGEWHNSEIDSSDRILRDGSC